MYWWLVRPTSGHQVNVSTAHFSIHITTSGPLSKLLTTLSCHTLSSITGFLFLLFKQEDNTWRLTSVHGQWFRQSCPSNSIPMKTLAAQTSGELSGCWYISPMMVKCVSVLWWVIYSFLPCCCLGLKLSFVASSMKPFQLHGGVCSSLLVFLTPFVLCFEV